MLMTIFSMRGTSMGFGSAELPLKVAVQFGGVHESGGAAVRSVAAVGLAPP